MSPAEYSPESPPEASADSMATQGEALPEATVAETSTPIESAAAAPPPESLVSSGTAELPPDEPEEAPEPAVAAQTQQSAELPPDEPDEVSEPTRIETSWSASPPHESDGDTQNERLRAAFESNIDNAGKTFQPAYDAGSEAAVATTADNLLRTSRAYAGEHPLGHPEDKGAVSAWTTPQDLTEMTPPQIKDHLSLPKQPKHLADIHHPQGQQIVAGIAGPNDFNENKPAGGVQYEAQDKLDQTIASPQADWSEENQRWEPRLSGTFNRTANPEVYDDNAIFRKKQEEAPPES